MMEDCKHQDCRGEICDLLKKLPPNYPVAVVYVNGIPVPVWAFSNICLKSGLAYFVDEEAQVVTFDCLKIDGISFGEGMEKEEECC